MSFLFARDGVEALGRVDGNRDIDMVVSDINMPRMDGLSLLRSCRKATSNLSTIIVSAYGDMANIRTAMNRGAFDFLTKPIDFADLETTIAKTLRHVEILREARRRQPRPSGRTHRCRAISRPTSPSGSPSRCRAIDLAGQRREVAALFTDIAGFTTLVETIEPRCSEPLLNDYLAGMTDIVFAHEGTVAKIVGDALHVLFGAPGEQPDHAARAVACALALDAFAREFRQALARKRRRPRRDPHRRARRAGHRRQFRRRPLLRLHGLWRHHQHRGAARSGQQAARHARSASAAMSRQRRGFSRPPGRRPRAEGSLRAAPRLRAADAGGICRARRRGPISRRSP